jgi:RHS repeat-associated protein
MLRAVSEDGGTPEMTYYFGPFVHEGLQGGTSSLKYIITPEGRILNTGTDSSPIWKWEYNLKDHLGNVRVVLTPSTTAGYATVLQEDNYFPFGMKMSQLSTSITTTNDYLYNGKQLQTSFGLNWYDYGARFYDPALERFTSVDPMAEKYSFQSPYCYAANNPIMYVDVNGQGPGIGPTFISVSNLPTFLKMATYTDINDLVVLVSSLLTPLTGKGPINADRTSATPDDVEAAKMGLLLPAMSGSGAKEALNAAEETVEKITIKIEDASKIDRKILDAPSKPGDAPTFKSDGTKVEIHHEGQNPNGPFKEMHKTDHRGRGNDKVNHPDKGSESKIDRKEFQRARREYWKEEYNK